MESPAQYHRIQNGTADACKIVLPECKEFHIGTQHELWVGIRSKTNSNIVQCTRYICFTLEWCQIDALGQIGESLHQSGYSEMSAQEGIAIDLGGLEEDSHRIGISPCKFSWLLAGQGTERPDSEHISSHCLLSYRNTHSPCKMSWPRNIAYNLVILLVSLIEMRDPFFILLRSGNYLPR